MNTERVILASQSPRRKELLRRIVSRFDIIPSGADETRMQGESAEAYVVRVAKAKAEEVASREPDAWVLGADTSVVYEEHILGKPRSRDDARRMLSMLSGKTHRVLTGICVCSRARGVVVCDCAVTHVTFRPLSAEVVDRYLDTHTYADKAGAYGIQDIGDVFAAAIDGSFENVVGLPLEETARLLETARSKEGLA